MIDFFEDLTTTILILNALSGGTLLPVVAILAVVAAVCGLIAMRQRSSKAKRERSRRVVRQVHDSYVGHQPYDPAQDESDLIDRMAADYRRINKERDR